MKLFILLFSFISIITFAIGIYFFFHKYKSNATEKEKDRSIIIITLILLSICSYLLAISLDQTNDLLILPIDKDYSKIGPYGDLIGGLMNPVITFIGIIAALLAFYAQYIANQQMQEQFKIQQFESQFYEMLRLHKENVNEMIIMGYYNSIQKSFEYSNGNTKTTIIESQVDKIITGRKVFVSMINELHFCCDFCIEFNNKEGEKYSENDMLELGYKVFFHGSNSEFISTKDVNNDFIKSIQKEFKKIRKEHKKTNGIYNSYVINNKSIDLHIKYTPFTGHVSRLGHYYRHLFYMVKFVVENENKKLFNYPKSREYLKLLRAQMSNDEQLLLYYNFKIGFGKEWESEKNKFLSKYRMLHNLPTGKVKYDKPLKVFKEQIQQIKLETNGKETMFEWGD
jgi:hypothetical protein